MIAAILAVVAATADCKGHKPGDAAPQLIVIDTRKLGAARCVANCETTLAFVKTSSQDGLYVSIFERRYTGNTCGNRN